MLYSLCYKYLCGQNILKNSWSCSTEISGWQSEIPTVCYSYCPPVHPVLSCVWVGLCHQHHSLNDNMSPQIRLQRPWVPFVALHLQSLIHCYGEQQVAMLSAAWGQGSWGDCSLQPVRCGGLPTGVTGGGFQPQWNLEMTAALRTAWLPHRDRAGVRTTSFYQLHLSWLPDHQKPLYEAIKAVVLSFCVLW